MITPLPGNPPRIQQTVNTRNPVEGYRINDIDETTSTHYYGFSNKVGNWYVLKFDTTANTLRYFQGVNPSSYATNWTNRASLSYDYFHIIFKENTL